MAKTKKKKRSVFESVSPLIRRFRLPLVLVVPAILIIVGTREIMDRAERDALLGRLPRIEALSFNTEILRKKVDRTYDALRRTLGDGGPDKAFGRKSGQLGKLYQANHFYDQAVLCYQLAMEFDKESPRWPYYLSFIKQEKGENESILSLLKTTMALSPRYAPALLKLADIHFKTGKSREAKAYYKGRLDLLPGDPHALLGLARISLDASEWETARAYLEQAVKKNPQFGPAHRLIATVHEHFGRKDHMKRSLDRATQCTRFRPAPDPWVDSLNDLCYDVEQLLVLGSKALIDLDMDKASGFFNRAKDLGPENPQVHLALGRLYFMVGQRDRARGFFEKAIDLEPKSDEAYFQLGLILKTEGKLKEAEQMLVKALDFHPDNANVHNNLGVILLEQEKFREAVLALNKALEIYPEHINARYNLGLALWGLGKTEHALQEYRKILNVKPDWAVAANSLAWVLATDGNRNLRNGIQAIRWALVACKDDGRKNPEYLDTLAAAYAEAGRFTEAIEVARESIDLARSAGLTDLVKEVEKRLRLYEAEKAFTE